jgi:hypothetical protein
MQSRKCANDEMRLSKPWRTKWITGKNIFKFNSYKTLI